MALRWQLPVWSPLSLGAIAGGVLPRADSLTEVERRIRDEYGSSGVLLTGSGTIALALAYLASAAQGVRPRIALPAWACPDLMTAADAVDAEVVLYDLDPGTLGPELDSLRTALQSRPTAVVLAHWFGLPVDVGLIAGLIWSAGARLIDDAAQGVGASVRGRPVGTGGDYGILSFGRGKGRTGGGGGALLANTEDAARRLDQITSRLVPARGGVKSLGPLLGQWIFGRPSLYGLPMRVPALRLGQTVYHPAPELRRMDPSAAGVLARVWDLSMAEVAIRRRNAERWRGLLQGVQDVALYEEPPAATAGWLRYPIMVANGLVSRFRNSRMSRHGVSAGYPSLLCDLPMRTGRRLISKNGFSGALLLSQNLFALPVHQRVRERDVREIMRCVQ
jgi:perosamine synthetase